jgi:hypothetical protein
MNPTDRKASGGKGSPGQNDPGGRRTRAMSDAMKACIGDCLDCHAECLETVTHTCLELGGKHLEPEHVRLMLSCAEVCQAAANVMLSRASAASALCLVCADLCDACARSCERIGEMDHCAELCRRCAESCRQMAGVEGGKGKPMARTDHARSHA